MTLFVPPYQLDGPSIWSLGEVAPDAEMFLTIPGCDGTLFVTVLLTK